MTTRILPLAACIACAAIGLLVGILVTRAVMSESAAVEIYVDRTPAPQEVQIRAAAQELLDAFNEGRWEAANDSFASFCRGGSSPEELQQAWEEMGDYHFELRSFRVTEVHDDMALVDAEVILMTDESTGRFGPRNGSEPWLKSFTFEDGQWRACQ